MSVYSQDKVDIDEEPKSVGWYLGSHISLFRLVLTCWCDFEVEVKDEK